MHWDCFERFGIFREDLDSGIGRESKIEWPTLLSQARDITLRSSPRWIRAGRNEVSNARNRQNRRTMNRCYSVNVTITLPGGNVFVRGDFELEKFDSGVAVAVRRLLAPAFIARSKDEFVCSVVIVLSSRAD